MKKENIDKLNQIGSKIDTVYQMTYVLNTFLTAKETYNEDCSNASTLSNIILNDINRANEELLDYIQDMYFELYKKSNN